MTPLPVLDRRRPADKSARAIQNALDAVAGDLAAAKVRAESGARMKPTTR